ncbi:hypothetical protein [Pelagibius sp. Alg239-R121]|uniref:hypothetical protein n=1 Tax=Pelagibius sp. Alg239-R121 TaxID=2993448 RepID=UPI0024A79520|nr:hypothetical protein [Pelagibius sp. Alg239-R121]
MNILSNHSDGLHLAEAGSSLRSMTKWLSVLLLGLGVSGCATQGPPCSYDFRKQELIGAATSVLTDEYQRCTDHLLEKLADLQVAVAKAERDADRLDNLAKSSADEEREAMERLAEVNRDSRGALDDLNRLRAQNKQDRSRLSELVAQQEKLEEQKTVVTASALDGNAANLNAEIAALQRQQRSLREAINSELSS